jgi:hypothetical protein
VPAYPEVICTRACLQRLEGWYKQRDNRMYPAWAYVLPTTFLRLPYSLLAALLWTCIVYYPVGLAPEASRCVCASVSACMGTGVLMSWGCLPWLDPISR